MTRQHDDGATVIAFPLARVRPAEGAAAAGGVFAGEEPGVDADDEMPGVGALVDLESYRRDCMAELVALLAADGADVVAFARTVPVRFRRRLPAPVLMAAGLAAPIGGW